MGCVQPCSWVYNEREDAWPTSPTEFCLITPRSNACAAAINGKIYVAGALAAETLTSATHPVFGGVIASSCNPVFLCSMSTSTPRDAPIQSVHHAFYDATSTLSRDLPQAATAAGSPRCRPLRRATQPRAPGRPSATCPRAAATSPARPSTTCCTLLAATTTPLVRMLIVL